MDISTEIESILNRSVDMVSIHNSNNISLTGNGVFIRNNRPISHIEVLEELYKFMTLTNDNNVKLRIIMNKLDNEQRKFTAQAENPTLGELLKQQS